MLKVGRGASAPPFIVMDVIAAANARQAALPPGAPHVIRMEVGQPGTGAPAGAVAAAVAALRSGDALGYTEAFGRRSLRERIVGALPRLVRPRRAAGAGGRHGRRIGRRFRWRSWRRSIRATGWR